MPRRRITLTYRSQLQTGTATGAESYNGMVDCFRKIVKHEGYAPSSASPYSRTTD